MATAVEELRELLGERIPTGGSDADTMFTDARLLDLLNTTESRDEALAVAWKIKAAEYADLVDTSEGTSKRAMSDLHKHALQMAASYSTEIGGALGRTVVHRVSRF